MYFGAACPNGFGVIPYAVGSRHPPHSTHLANNSMKDNGTSIQSSRWVLCFKITLLTGMLYASLSVSLDSVRGSVEAPPPECPPMWSHSFEIRRADIKRMDRSRLQELKHFTTRGYENHMVDKPGHSHYALLHYLTRAYGDACRPVVDIGTRYVASSLALGASGTPVHTFDLPTSHERVDAFRGLPEHEWQSQLQDAGVHVDFHNTHVLQLSDAEFAQTIASTWLILLDTHHKPYTIPFEREFVERLRQSNFQGLLVLDDIHLSPEMEEWWAELQSQGYRTLDVTVVGHSSGTGIVDFSGRARFL